MAVKKKIDVWLAVWIVCAIAIVGGFAIGFPIYLGQKCEAVGLGEKPLSYNFTIQSQSRINYRTTPKNAPPNAGPIAEGSQEQAQGSASPENKSANPENAWGQKFWCGVNASDYFIALFTLVLAIVTAFLWWTTHRLWKSGEYQIAAAKRSADAAVGIHLPIVRFIRPDMIWEPSQFTEFGLPINGGGVHRDLPRILYIQDLQTVNEGPTAAIAIAIEVDWCIAPSLPEEPPKCRYVVPCSGGEVIPPEEKDTPEWDISDMVLVLTETERQAVNSQQSNLWVFGLMKFTDFLNEERIARFGWKWGSEYSVGDRYFYRAPDVPRAYNKVN